MMNLHEMMPRALRPMDAEMQLMLEQCHIAWGDAWRNDARAALATAGLQGTPLVVAATNTQHAIPAVFVDAPRVLLPAAAHATEEHAAAISVALGNAPWLLGVGSGTVNDLCKYVSAHSQRPYAVIPTAPSMNGYVSRNASITLGGIKRTVAATLPRMVLCDAAILATAPARMRAAGFGDAMARATAQMDWLLSHHMAGTPYDPRPFALLTNNEPRLLAAAAGVGAAEPAAMALLMENLLLSGLGMTLAGGSYPASQSEHLIAHTLEHQGLLADDVLHGEIIAITTLTALLTQQRLLGRSAQQLACGGAWRDKVQQRWEQSPARIRTYFGAAHAEEILHIYQQKFPSAQHVLEMMEHPLAHWDTWRTELPLIALPPNARQLQHALTTAGAPTTPEALGLNPTTYQPALRHAHFLRDRITCLDVVYYLA